MCVSQAPTGISGWRGMHGRRPHQIAPAGALGSSTPKNFNPALGSRFLRHWLIQGGPRRSAHVSTGLLERCSG
jgi:hypothetical protein